MTDQYRIPDVLLFHHGEIDLQHQGLLDTLNVAQRLLQTATAPPANCFYPLLERLHDNLTLHFQEEEREMARLDYPDLAAHKLHHAHCVERLDAICDAVVSGEKIVDSEFLNDLFDMVMDDIIRADSGFKSFIQSLEHQAPA